MILTKQLKNKYMYIVQSLLHRTKPKNARLQPYQTYRSIYKQDYVIRTKHCYITTFIVKLSTRCRYTPIRVMISQLRLTLSYKYILLSRHHKTLGAERSLH